MCEFVCVCVSVALVIQDATRMCHIILPAACPFLPNFPTLSHKMHDFGAGEVIELRVIVLMFSTSFV